MQPPPLEDFRGEGEPERPAPLGFRRAESAFCLLAAPGAESRQLNRFREWLVAEGAKTPEAPTAP